MRKKNLKKRKMETFKTGVELYCNYDVEYRGKTRNCKSIIETTVIYSNFYDRK
jgi:hypothetical protein